VLPAVFGPQFPIGSETGFGGTPEVRYVRQSRPIIACEPLHGCLYRAGRVKVASGIVEYFVETEYFVTLNLRYVNMADINFKRKASRPVSGDDPVSAEPAGPQPRWDIIELLFFAYRDFVGDADHALEGLGFGRAHHRVVHFVHRYPGLKVADLLEVLRITKQSLGRVLKQLLDEEYIVQKAGDSDRRQRLLFATAKGEALVAKLARLQTDRINHALAELGPGGGETVRRFLRGMIDQDDPDKVLDSILGTDGASARD
jgi:DNA-binding MarR family transcriptional regulator